MRKENKVVLSYRWPFQDGRSKGMGTEWDKEVVGKVDPQKRVLCLAQVFLRGMPLGVIDIISHVCSDLARKRIFKSHNF